MFVSTPKTYYYFQDSTKTNSPVHEQPRVGFDEEERSTGEEIQKETTSSEKQSPFAKDVNKLLEEQKKAKKKEKGAKSKDDQKKEEKSKVERNKDEKSNDERNKDEKSKDERNKDNKSKEEKTEIKEAVLKEQVSEVSNADTAKPAQILTVTIKNPLKIKKVLSPVKRNYQNQDGIFLLFLLICILFGWINVFHRRRFAQVINAFFITRYINQLIREENATLQRVFVMVSVIFILVLSIFGYQSLNYFNITIPGVNKVQLFMMCALGISIMYFVKLMSLFFVGHIMKAEKIVKEYFYNIFLINNFIGIILVPIVLSIAYLPWINKDILMQTGVGLYLLSFVYRILRGGILGWSNGGYSLVHVF